MAALRIPGQSLPQTGTGAVEVGFLLVVAVGLRVAQGLTGKRATILFSLIRNDHGI